MSSQGLLDFLGAWSHSAPKEELHSLMVVRRGAVVAEGWWSPFQADRKHLLYSLSKSFMSTAIGLAIGEGRLSLDDRVIDFFPDEAPAEISDNLAAMRVRHLLSMSTGHATEPGPREQTGWVKMFLAHPVPHEPGSHFLYNSLATFLLSAILQKLTGQRTLDYLGPRLLAPLGIEEATWGQNPDGIDLGGWGMSVCTESIAKFGLLYLQDGVWEGTRLLPEGWVTEATRLHIQNGPSDWADWNSGYGFQFWRCQTGCYRGDGAFGQFCVVVPEQELVVVMTASAENLQLMLDRVWAHLLPACASEPTPDAEIAHKLQSQLKGLRLGAPKGSGFAPYEAVMTGKVFQGDGGEMSWQFDAEGCAFRVSWEGVDEVYLVGRRDWRLKEGEEPTAATGAWEAEDTYVVRVQYVEEPYHVLYRAKFSKGTVTVHRSDFGRFVPGPTSPFIGQC